MSSVQFHPPKFSSGAGRVIGLSIAGLIALVLLVLNPFSERAMFDIEAEVIILLNGLLGRNWFWDWFIILGAHPGILFGIMVLLLAAFAVEGWRIRRLDHGRVYGYGLLVILLAITVGVAVDSLSFRLAQREAPWTVLGGLDDLRNFYTTEFLSMSLVDGYVDGNLVGWCCAVVLLWNRAAVTARIMLGIILFHAFSEVSLGEQWPMAHVLALLIGACIGGVGLLRLERVFAQAERHMADFFVARAWRQLTPEGPYETPSTLEMDKPRLVATGTDGQESRPASRLWMKLARREVMPVISMQPGEYVLTRKPPQEEGIPFKPSRFVRFIRAPHGEVFVVKAVWRWTYPLTTPRRVLLYRLHARNTLALERLSFPVPRLYWVREGNLNFGFRRYFLLVEEYLPGRPLNRQSYEEASMAIRLLAQLHENKRIGWGAISESGKPSVEEYIWTHLRPRVMYLLNRIGRLYGAEWPSDLATQVWSWFEALVFKMGSRQHPPFRLIHGDVTRNNFILVRNNVKMLDLLSLRYDWAGWEIIKAAVSFSQSGEVWRGRIWEDYFEEAGSARWREFLRHSGVSVGFYALYESAHYRAFGIRKRSIPADPEAFARRLYRLMHDETIWGDSPSSTDWARLDQYLKLPLGELDSDGTEGAVRVIEATN